jgi:hypothetical protein
MKKIISLLLLLLSVGIFFWYSFYIKKSFDYQIAQFIGYLFYWSVTLFIVSLFALVLNKKKYKIWLLATLVYVFISILIAYETGDGNGAIISFDGKDLTWFFVGLYSFISIIYFIVQFFKNKKQSTLV